MAELTIGVLALQGDVREHLRALTGCGVAARVVRRPEELDEVDALVIPGGESTTMSKLAIEFGVLDPIRKRIAEGMPAYGSCAGMIMLAEEVLDGRPDQQGFGGMDVTVRRNAFGRQVQSFEAAVDITGVTDHADGGPFRAVFIRAPWVERAGPKVSVLARIPVGGASRTSPAGEGSGSGVSRVGPAEPPAGRIVAVRQGNLLATAFHPELTGDLRVHRFFVEMTRAARADDVEG